MGSFRRSTSAPKAWMSSWFVVVSDLISESSASAASSRLATWSSRALDSARRHSVAPFRLEVIESASSSTRAHRSPVRAIAMEASKLAQSVAQVASEPASASLVFLSCFLRVERRVELAAVRAVATFAERLGMKSPRTSTRIACRALKIDAVVASSARCHSATALARAAMAAAASALASPCCAAAVPAESLSAATTAVSSRVRLSSSCASTAADSCKSQTKDLSAQAASAAALRTLTESSIAFAWALSDPAHTSTVDPALSIRALISPHALPTSPDSLVLCPVIEACRAKSPAAAKSSLASTDALCLSSSSATFAFTASTKPKCDAFCSSTNCSSSVLVAASSSLSRASTASCRDAASETAFAASASSCSSAPSAMPARWAATVATRPEAARSKRARASSMLLEAKAEASDALWPCRAAAAECSPRLASSRSSAPVSS
mmetsp:Transcript_48887/g.110940  ORF Transcript_48887/g.110940 Transcript_48887/m.110940 type:complete len:438 (+) Transcript_48887:367-1680(+)